MKRYIRATEGSKIEIHEEPQYIDDNNSSLSDQSIFTFDGGSATLSERFIAGDYYYIAIIKFDDGYKTSRSFEDKGLHDDSARESAIEWIDKTIHSHLA